MNPFCDSAALVDLEPYAKSFEVSGGDAQDYLQRMLSADLRKLKPSRGLTSTMMTSKGKMIAAFEIFDAGADRFALQVDPIAFDPLADGLERLVILEDVVLDRTVDVQPRFSLQGPRAAAILHQIFDGLVCPEDPLEAKSVDGVTVVRRHRSAVGGWDLWLSRDRSADVHESLRAAGAVDVDYAAAETARIDGGYARFGVDADGSRMPPEAVYDDAISYDKGCYPGQEVVARIRTYGHVNWLLRRVRWATEELAPADTELTNADGKVVGRVTSCAATGAGAVALAYVRYQTAEPGSSLTVSLPSGAVVGTLEELGA